jgi:hypothetical protein
MPLRQSESRYRGVADEELSERDSALSHVAATVSGLAPANPDLHRNPRIR